jgi:outer membrane beta-barrel protein
MERNMKKTVIALCTVASVWAVPHVAWGQKAPIAQETKAQASKGSAGDAADNVRGRAADESIYVVQRRAYSKSGKFEISPLFFTGVNAKFVGYYGGGLSVAYHFQENFGLEFTTSFFTLARWSTLVLDVWEYENLTPEEVDLKQFDYFNALSLQFSALYGKLDFYGHLIDYDFFVFAGLGYTHTLEPCTPTSGGGADDGRCGDVVGVGRGLQAPERAMDAHKISGHLGGGIRLFFHEMFGLKAELRNISYSDRKVEGSQAGSQGSTTTDIRSTMLLMLAASFIL